MLIQQNLFHFIIIVIISVEYFSECNGYHLKPSTFNNNLIRFKRQAGCKRRQFTCDNGQCISINNYCDGKSDCSDESDEELNCNTNGCSSNKFQCAYGACIGADLKCDGKPDCRDNSDEEKKICYPNHCVAPTIQNGKLTVAGIDYTPGSLINESSIITVECNSDYKLSVNNLPKCVAALWDIGIPKCVPANATLSLEENKECPAPFIEYGKYEIVGNPQYISGDPIPNFDIVKFTCINDNYALTVTNNLQYCLNGHFENELPKCVRTCPAKFSSASIDIKCELNDVQLDCSKKVPSGTIAKMKCRKDYVDIIGGPSIAICIDGSWDVPTKKCLPVSCNALSTSSTDVTCELNGVKQDCSKKVVEGTIATMQCKPYYVGLDRGPTITTCSRGSWDKPVKECVPDCGVVGPTAQILSDHGTIPRKSDFPWHVAIYKQESMGSPYYICGGSIINEKIILSGAVCFTSPTNGTIFPVTEYLIAAGKIYSDWDAPQDADSVQKRKISKIETPKDIYTGFNSYFIGDVAVVVVEEPFVFTNFIRPVCVDWFSEFEYQQLQTGKIGKVPGWGPLTSDEIAPRPILKQLSLPYVELYQCINTVPDSFKNYLTRDKFCAGFANGTNLCKGDSGSGMVFKKHYKYYIQGIVSLAPAKDGLCDFYQLSILTKVNKYISFIRNITSSNEKFYEEKKPLECYPPVIPNGNFKVLAGNEYISYTQQKPIPNFTIVNISCVNSNYKLSTPYSLIYCVEGKYPQEIPKCVLTCTPKFSNSIDVTCRLNGIRQDCTEEVLEGTIAYMKCKPDYIDNSPKISKATCTESGTWDVPPKQCSSPYTCPARSSNAIDIFCELNGVPQDCNKEVPDGTISRMRCKKNYVDFNNGPSVALCSNGSWSEAPKKCIPDCGQIHQEGRTYIINGTSASRDDFPWHVAIYRHQSQESLDYKCGGSIISVKVVITAAHCVTDANNGDLYPASEFKVAAGKKYSKWNAPEDENYVQTRNVVKMHTPRDVYFGQLSSYAGDVAALIVDRIFTFTNFVKPICVDWKSEHVNQQLKDGNLGIIAGWGSTTIGNPIASVNLKQLAIPFVRRDKCVEIVPKHFISYVTVDKYCAGYTNGLSVCDGDSGGGMAFPYHNKNGGKTYILQGIVSAGPSVDGHCDDHQLGVYTKISNYITFIRDVEESNRV